MAFQTSPNARAAPEPDEASRVELLAPAPRWGLLAVAGLGIIGATAFMMGATVLGLLYAYLAQWSRAGVAAVVFMIAGGAVYGLAQWLRGQ